ncbi:MAG: precorrin-2/cobalt-factor-2 C20-methyltransferase [Candidatus Tokpelaia sp. JSC188]|nr:MAG: precorrin-2/cobalt-factor-2 C20-methyltransferase [Candidatus Tokpelaia sp. JSC188]
MSNRGKLYGIGVGPGDPELITLKALKALAKTNIVAFHQAEGKKSNALTIAECWIKRHQQLLPFVYPTTTEILSPHENYEFILADFYEKISKELRYYLDNGKTIAILAEGDPLFYSSFMYIYNRIGNEYETEVIPGITSVSASASALGVPLCYRNQTFTVLSGVLDQLTLEKRLAVGEAFAIIKLGRNLDKVRTAIYNAGLIKRALYIERATMASERIISLCAAATESSPYFSLVLIPGISWN